MILLSSILILIVTSVSERQTHVSADAASTGKAIGTGINAAISAAFPAISTVINAIWPKSDDNSNKKKTDAAAATQDLQKKANEGLAQLDKVTSDLDTITLFLANCVVADNHVVAMRTLLDKDKLSEQDKLQLEDHWNKAKGRLSRLKDAGGSVTKMNDPSVQTVLQAVVDTTAGAIDSITKQLSAGDAARPLLSKNLEELDEQLSAVNALSGQIIQNISSGLKSAKNTPAGRQGALRQTASLKQAHDDFAQTLSLRYKLK